MAPGLGALPKADATAAAAAAAAAARVLFSLILLLAAVNDTAAEDHPWSLGDLSEGPSAPFRQMAADPEALRDTFRDLTPTDLARLSRTSPHWRRELLGSHLTVGVEVVLVGFLGDGRGQVRVDEADLAAYLGALRTEAEWNQPGRSSTKGLPIRFFFRVRHGNQRLLREASDAVRAAANSHTPEAGVALVPRSAVDAAVARDARTAELAYSLYILNLPPAPKPHFYTYGDGGCPGTLWVAEDRYAWVDVSAGPVEHGSATSAAEGAVMERTFPNMTALASKAGASRAQRGGAALELVPLVDSMCKHLLARPAARPPAWDSKHGARVVVVRMTDAAEGEGDAAAQDSGGYLAVLRRELQKLRIGEAGVTVEQVDLPFRDCSRCVAAYARSLRNDLVLGDDGEPTTKTYLDLAELKQWLNPLIEDPAGTSSYTSSEKEVMGRLAGRSGEGSAVPVFLFDLSMPSVLLIDGEHQAAPLDHNAAVAVRTRFSLQAPAAELGVESNFECQGLPVRFDPSNIGKPMLAAVLQAAWGLRETHVAADTLSGYERRDFRWSVGQDPFTPLSQATSLSFALKDAALHNAVLPRLVSVRDYLLGALDTLSTLSPGAQHYILSAVPRERRRLFVQRTNFLMHKYTRALKMMSANRAEEASYLAQSMLQHDVKAHMAEMSVIEEQVRSSLVCSHSGQDGQQWLLWLGGLGILLGTMGAYTYSHLASRRRRHLKAF